MTRTASSHVYRDRLKDLERPAPEIAAALLDKYQTIGRAKSAARWEHPGILGEMIVERLEALWASRPQEPRHKPRTASGNGRKSPSRSSLA